MLENPVWRGLVVGRFVGLAVRVGMFTCGICFAEEEGGLRGKDGAILLEGELVSVRLGDELREEVVAFT